MSKVRRPPGRCHYCGVAPGVTADHVIPKSRGGTNNPWNLVPACVRCNQAKADLVPTCQCPFCQDAIEKHWQWLMEWRDYKIQNALVLKVMSLYPGRWPNTRGTP